jgi:hypothetical protein
MTLDSFGGARRYAYLARTRLDSSISLSGESVAQSTMTFPAETPAMIPLTSSSNYRIEMITMRITGWYEELTTEMEASSFDSIAKVT